MDSVSDRTARTHSTDGADLLTRGAFRLFDEMIRRLPVHSKDSDELVNWMLVYNRLTFAIFRMGIWPLLWERHHKYFRDMIDALWRLAHKQRSSLFSQWIGRSHGNSVERLLFCDFPWREGRSEWMDALDDLHQWPVPLRLGLGSQGNNNNPTLLNFLAAFLANPPKVFGSPSFLAEIDLALFAAARAIAPSANNWAGYSADFFEGLGAPVSLRRLMADRLAKAAWAWLAEQLPRRGFGPMLEQAIEKTSNLVTA
jgi:hypothetical protein